MLTTIVLAPLAAGATWVFTAGDTTTTTLVGAGCLSSILISPDLDMEERTISESLIFRVSSILGMLWMALWYPYALMAKHRGVSHIPIFGTLTRLLYIAVVYLSVHVLLHYVSDDFDAYIMMHYT
ncbi:MAG: DUF2227 family putative metal-binding protein [Anaerolineae bacterium]|nr:DUF2227 family putative metal-binding protein [Anaerolineae bacterium]